MTDPEDPDSPERDEPRYTAEELGIEPGGPPFEELWESSDESLPSPLNRISQWLSPLREGYGRINRRLDPLREISSASNRAVSRWYEDRHILWRFVISSGIAEVFFRIGTVAWVTATPLIGREALPSMPVVPAYVPLAICALALFTFFQWLRLKRGVELWTEPDDPPAHIRWSGASNVAVVGGSLGSFFGAHGLVLGIAIGAVFGDEIERRVDIRIRRASEARVERERTVAEEMGRAVERSIEERSEVHERR